MTKPRPGALRRAPNGTQEDSQLRKLRRLLAEYGLPMRVSPTGSQYRIWRSDLQAHALFLLETLQRMGRPMRPWWTIVQLAADLGLIAQRPTTARSRRAG